jgi:hypothetical protein
MESAPSALRLDTRTLAEGSRHKTLGKVMKRVHEHRKMVRPAEHYIFPGGGAQAVTIGKNIAKGS